MGNEQYAIEMLNITKRFPGIIANDNITLQLRHGFLQRNSVVISEQAVGTNALSTRPGGNVLHINKP